MQQTAQSQSMFDSDRVKMASEKTPSLFAPNGPFEEKPQKTSKVSSKTLLSLVLAALLIALVVALCVQFFAPRRATEIDEIHIYDGKPIQIDVKTNGPQETNSVEGKAPWHLDFLINPSRLCETTSLSDQLDSAGITLLVLVPSATDHFDQRRAIRNTWGSVSDSRSRVRVGFVMGTTSNTTVEDMILHESGRNGDIIQADFEDNERNQTVKSVLMLKWVSEYCPGAQYLLKTSDDTFVNLDVVSRILKKRPYKTAKTFIGGFVSNGMQKQRTPMEKQFFPEDDFSDLEYPPYVSGSTYLTSGPTASELFEAAKQTRPFLPFEDLFITGLCADQIDASLIHEPSFRTEMPVRPLNFDSYSNLATAHSISPDEIEQLWDQMMGRLAWAGDIMDDPSPLRTFFSSNMRTPPDMPRMSDFQDPSSILGLVGFPFSFFDKSDDGDSWPEMKSLPDSWKFFPEETSSDDSKSPKLSGRAKITVKILDGKPLTDSNPEGVQSGLPEIIKQFMGIRGDAGKPLMNTSPEEVQSGLPEIIRQFMGIRGDAGKTLTNTDSEDVQFGLPEIIRKFMGIPGDDRNSPLMPKIRVRILDSHSATDANPEEDMLPELIRELIGNSEDATLGPKTPEEGSVNETTDSAVGWK